VLAFGPSRRGTGDKGLGSCKKVEGGFQSVSVHFPFFFLLSLDYCGFWRVWCLMRSIMG